jgi:hypothetical protein
MRLTELAGSNVYLELFVIADKQATNEKLVLEFSDKYDFKKEAEQGIFKGQYLPGFTGKKYHHEIGHPFAQKLMWDGCMVTRLCGTIQPRQMNDDILLKLSAAKPYQKHYFSRNGAFITACFVCMSMFCILLIVLTIIFKNRIGEANRGKFYWTRIILPMVLSSLLLLGVIYAAIPKINVETRTKYGRWLWGARKHAMANIAEKIAQQNDYFSHKDVNEVTKVVNNFFKTDQNLYTRKEIKQEDSPGNYTIFKNEQGEIVMRFYSEEAYPYDFPLTSKPERPYAGN